LNSKNLQNYYMSMLKDVDERLNDLYSREAEEEFNKRLKENGFTRRDFLKWASFMTAALMLPPAFEPRVAKAAAIKQRTPVIWLHLAECTACSESFLRTREPSITQLIFNYISLTYHDTLMMASGERVEKVLNTAIQKYKGQYVCVIEGGIPTKDGGIFLRIGSKGETGLERARRITRDAKVVLAFGTCAAYGGVQAAYPNPTGAKGVRDALGIEVVNVPGCPPNSINMVGTVLHLLLFNKVPPTDLLYRPLWAYGSRIHDYCERRAHFDAGEFVEEWGDAGAKKGWCLYKMGCKGPLTYNDCSRYRFNQGTNWPIGAGHGCIGCSQPDFWDKMAPFEEPNEKAGIRIPGGNGVEATSDEIGGFLAGATAAGIGVHAIGSVIRAKVEKKKNKESESKIEKNINKENE